MNNNTDLARILSDYHDTYYQGDQMKEKVFFVFCNTLKNAQQTETRETNCLQIACEMITFRLHMRSAKERPSGTVWLYTLYEKAGGDGALCTS